MLAQDTQSHSNLLNDVGAGMVSNAASRRHALRAEAEESFGKPARALSRSRQPPVRTGYFFSGLGRRRFRYCWPISTNTFPRSWVFLHRDYQFSSCEDYRWCDGVLKFVSSRSPSAGGTNKTETHTHTTTCFVDAHAPSDNA